MKTSLIFVGGGLANGLAAFRLFHHRPDISFVLVEAGETLGGNHTWSFHDADLSAPQRTWLSPLISKSWDGTDVFFPAHQRTLSGRYHSLQSADFHRALASLLGSRVRTGRRAVAVEATRVILDNGEILTADAVIDGRGWSPPASPSLGWQKFVGLELELAAPHGLERPVIMDATVSQDDGYRFFYLLPWDNKRVLVEDTHYSDTPDLDVARYRSEIVSYALRRGWTILSATRMESASLPIPLGGSPLAPETGVTASGLRAGLFHPTTGYSLPDAVRFADALAGRTSFAAPDLSVWASARARRHWRRGGFFRLLNRLMFRAARPDQRYRILERFYRRNEAMIGRFYSGQLSGLDRIRIFSGRPPVPLGAAMQALTFSTGGSRS